MKTSIIGRADKKHHSSDCATVNGFRSLSHRAFIGGSRKMVCLLAALTHMLMFASIDEANSGLPAVEIRGEHLRQMNPEIAIPYPNNTSPTNSKFVP